jgi:hypothetical protein
MSQSRIALFQSILTGMQAVNLGLGTVTKDPLITLLVGAVVLAMQQYANQLGNSSISEPVKARLSELDDIHQANAAAVASAQPPTPAPAAPTVPPHSGWGK